MRKLSGILSVIFFAICIICAGSAFASESISVNLNGKTLSFDAEPFMQNDRVMVPLRTIAEAMGAEVNWSQTFVLPEYKTPMQTVRVVMGDSVIIMNIGNETFSINGNQMQLDAMPVIKDERTFVPVRFFCEAMNAEVDWDGETQTVIISGKKTFGLAGGVISLNMPVGTEIKRENSDLCESAEYLEFENAEGKISVYAENLCMTSVGNLEIDCENLGFEYEEAENLPFDARYVKSDDGISLITANPDGRLVLIKVKYEGENGRVLAREFLESISFNAYAYPDAVNIEGYRISQLDGKYEVQNMSAGNKEHFRIRKIVSSSGNQPVLDIVFSDSEIEKGIIETTNKKYYGTLFEDSATWYLFEDDKYMLYTAGRLTDSTYYYISGKSYSSKQQRDFIKLTASISRGGGGMGGKPVIYLYPEKETYVNVELNLNGEFIFTYPEYNTGWNVTAFPDGKIISDGEEYSYLFWEGTMPELNTEITEGFVVKGSESAVFLRDILKKMGLTPKEYNEFIVYWAPILAQNEYNKIYFAGDEYTSQARLDITPKPDSVLRIFMIYEKADENTVLPPQDIETFERKGFTVVEWGGNMVN